MGRHAHGLKVVTSASINVFLLNVFMMNTIKTTVSAVYKMIIASVWLCECVYRETWMLLSLHIGG